MPNINELKKIIKLTPANQAILLESAHGMGKSEVTEQILKSENYSVVKLFLGQVSDAGDVIGLPDRIEVDFDGDKRKITRFCPPQWWPQKKDIKLGLVLDELNRAKPEILNCILDMVLNHELMGLKLPEDTRIIACINPIGDDYSYDVNEMEPALLDRFNKYEFNPDLDEWIDWAVKEKVNNNVLAFISKNPSYLDPPNGREMKADQVYQSRRSWKRVSDIMNKNQEIEEDEMFFKTLLMGIVGIASASKFITFLHDTRKDISAGQLITCMPETWQVMEDKIKLLSVPECMHLNKQIMIWFKGHQSLIETGGKREIAQYTYNFEKYLKLISPENMAECMDQLIQTYNNNTSEQWTLKILEINPGISKMFKERMFGKQDEELKKNIINENEQI